MKKNLGWFTIMLTALVMGVFWGTWFTLTRSLENFPPESFILIGKTIIHNVAVPMSILMPLTLVCMAVYSWMNRKNKPTLYLSLTALALMIITLIITVGVEVPIDNMIKTWTSESIPADWEALRSKWKYFHGLRTLTSITSLGILVIATNIREESGGNAIERSL